MEDVSKQGRTVLFVSHNMAAVSNLCGRGLVLTDGMIGFEGNVNDAVQHYNQQVAASGQRDGQLEPHVLYVGPTVQSNGADCTITRIEVLDGNRNPKPILSTWDTVVFRLCYQSNRQIKHGSVVLRLGGQDGSRLVLLSTQPDGTLPLDLEPGEHAVDCEIEQFPLSAGSYIVGAGLALPNTTWLWWHSDLCTLSVFPRDVYGSGLAPHAGRALLAVKHRWIRVLSSNDSA
jgi:lipopolysaccharide transport system ATP-binding protein